MKDEYENHPKWNELIDICNKIEKMKIKAKRLRQEINNDIFGDKEIN